jgi:signal transduction histidine kinase
MFSNISRYQKVLLIPIAISMILSIMPFCFVSGESKTPGSLKNTRETTLYQTKPAPANHEVENTRLKTEKEKDQTIINDQRVSLSIGTFSAIIICVGLVIMEQLYRQVKAKNKLIQEQNSRLENSNKVKDTIFSIISHDLRNPISQVIGLLDLWEEGDMTIGEIEALLPTFKVSSLNTLELVDNLLIWSKNQLQNFDYYPVSFNVSKAADGVINKLRPTIAQKNLSVVNKISPSIIVYADEEMITIILRNLVSNAAKFTSEKGFIWLTGTMKDGFATIAVADDGIGIKTEDQAEIFNAPADLKASKEKSPGLGLKICKDFITLNYGQIWVESRQNEGSKFYISIPVDEHAARQPLQEPEAALV